MGEGKTSYDEAIQYLYGLQKYGIKFGLSKTLNLLKAFGDPHRGQKYLHIAGTNGKGSVGAMVESILSSAGYKVGFYSSPHLVRFTERFRINGREISQNKAASIAAEVIDAINPQQPPTFFEVTTAMALIYFAREKTDVSIMEVGMGGRLDATNVIKPALSVITNISLEHQFFLGPRLTDIAREKAGIIKEGVDVVTAVTQPSVLDVVRGECSQKKAPLWRVGKHIRYRKNGKTLNYYGLSRKLGGLELGLNGRYQNRNAALALAVVEILERGGFEVTIEHIKHGLKYPNWPGRMHVFSRNPLLILDGAHNPAAIRQLVDSITRDFSYRNLILVLGVMGDKDIARMLRRVAGIADYTLYTRPHYYRAASPEALKKEAERIKGAGESVDSIPEALQRAKAMARPGDAILVTGSLFTVGEALSYLDPEKFKPDPVRQVN